jgi:hypothetical protein
VILFAVHDCGYVARCALEADDSGDIRIEKIRYHRPVQIGIHDISRTEPNEHNLPRFKMPLELGCFWALGDLGAAEQRKLRLS